MGSAGPTMGLLGLSMGFGFFCFFILLTKVGGNRLGKCLIYRDL
jgi:hypothetical protein